ncbi:MAG: cobalamin biosynthesis protein CbiX [Opitutales bacterium]|nr:cobalamin biosynthesis protein CbiX [Opitutales bacterium]MDG2167389.1 cobalamin biosynthesis protein CbiX [Opitutales bacterium]
MIFLVDNGSVRADAYRNLRSIASRVSESISNSVIPAPLLHADKIPEADLDDERVTLLEAAIKEAYSSGERSFEIIPLFFGPSGALVDYLPRRLKGLMKHCPEMEVRILNPLYVSSENGGASLATILKERVVSVQMKEGLQNFNVVLVDHGSPRQEVTNVRNAVGEILNQSFGEGLNSLIAASMERRPGEQYAFNEPLLANALESFGDHPKPIILAHMFFSPGRHAGPEGDITAICEASVLKNPALQIHKTELIGSHPLLVELLANRWQERNKLPWLEL